MFKFVPYLIGCILSLVAHEAGHLLAAIALGVRVRKIAITWWGPYLVREPGPPLANAIISAAGPGVNLVIAALAWHSWPMFGMINLVLGVANLLPTATSDGRRAWRAFQQKRADRRAAVDAQRASSSIPIETE